MMTNTFVMAGVILLSCFPVAFAGEYLDYKGFRYVLANQGVDIDVYDFSGDDCQVLPCPSFPIPVGCNATFPTSDMATIAQAKQWSTSYLVTADGLYPVTDWMNPAQPSSSLLDSASTPGYVALSDSGWQARIVLRCNIPCPPGSVLNGSACSSCPGGTWSSVGGTACIRCTNGPLRGVYTSGGAVTSNCSYTCPSGSYSQALLSPYLVVGDQSTIRAVDASGTVTTLYKPSPLDNAYGFTFMTFSKNNQQIIYLGSYAINRLNISSRNIAISTIAGQTAFPYRGMANGVGTRASFNTIVTAALWQNEGSLLCLDSVNCNIRQVDLTTYAVSTAAGATCGFQEGVGPSALFKYPTDMVFSTLNDFLYVSDAGNYRIRAVSLGSMSVSTLVGNGAPSNIDGVGTSATIDPRYLAISPDGTILYVKTVSTLRSIVISTQQITTLVALSGTSPSPIAAGMNGAIYFTSGLQLSRAVLSSGNVFPIAGSGAAGTTDGPGTVATFLQPLLLAVANESAAGTLACLTCSLCPAGQQVVCNSTYSECVPCPLGRYSAANSRVCLPCSPGMYGIAGGVCTSCPPGTFSALAATECTNCSAGTFSKASASMCSNCSVGTYSNNGATTCLNCTGLMGNASYVGFGSAGPTSCDLSCLPGFSFAAATGTCSVCIAGQWAPAGTTSCFSCTGLPANAAFSGVGASASRCPFTCNGGFLSNGTACIPCPPGTRMDVGRCVPCPNGAWSASAATGCSACAAGTYATGGASACTACPIQGPYVTFIGRGTSASCPFYCKAGSYIFNRTACVPCTNGTFAALGATACQTCPPGTWSDGGAGSCNTCRSLEITAEVGTGSVNYGALTSAGWSMSRWVCIP